MATLRASAEVGLSLAVLFTAACSSNGYGTPPAAEGPAQKPVTVAAAPVVQHLAKPLPDVTFEDKWRGTSFGAILVPAESTGEHSYIHEDGSIDVAFHFHGGQMAGKAWRAAKLNAVVASATFGIGSHVYRDKLDDPTRFPAMLDETIKTASVAAGRKLHLGKLLLVGWSAGYGAVDSILEKDALYNQVSAVVLLDGLHADYKTPVDPGMPREPDPDNVNLAEVAGIVRFAKDAAAGRTTMVITHSSIMPPDYAGTTEATAAVLHAVGLEPETVDEAAPRDMHLIRKLDHEGLHVRGFSGQAAHDHIQQLSLVEDEVSTFVAPRFDP